MRSVLVVTEELLADMFTPRLDTVAHTVELGEQLFSNLTIALRCGRRIGVAAEFVADNNSTEGVQLSVTN